ncbi:hypothetical protein ATCC90586_005532 [Pythium insidiosum]|nr:hypothetical protein ATCC90586_005532 [Pythium insidiosum]
MMGNGSRITMQRNRKVTLPPGYSQLHWMRLTQSGQDLSGLRGGPKRRLIPMDEVALHNTEDDCWSVLDGRVYNLTAYLKFHPGGVATVMMSAGADCTALFNENHAWVNGHSMLEKCYIGDLDPDSVDAGEDSSAAASPFALDATHWRPFKLLMKQRVCEMTYKFTFELPPGKKLGLEIPGQHLKVRATINDRVIERAYTPTSKFSQMGSFDLVIKLYPDGAMSSFLETLSVGATVEMLGPHGAIGYPAPRTVTRGSKTVQSEATHLVLLAGGTGITPMLQLVRAVFERSEDTATRVTLLYASRSLAFAIALEQLEPLANMFPARFTLHHFLSQASPDDAKQLGAFTIGRLDGAALAQHVPHATDGVAAFLCGPPDFEDAVRQSLETALGFGDHQIHQF